MAAGDQEFGDVSPKKYEYLDNPADIQLHSWGDNMKEAYEQVVVAMFGYMTDIETVDMLEKQEVEAEGEDMESLLYHLLDEFLFLFSAEPFFIARKVVITEFDVVNFRIKAEGYGETFDLDKHPQIAAWQTVTNKSAFCGYYDKYLQSSWFMANPLPKRRDLITVLRDQQTPASGGYINKSPAVMGTEVKAITYSNMQIYDKENQHELFVIIDI